MNAIFSPCTLKGFVDAPPSKSMAHRYLICAALSKKSCSISGVDFNQDILASIDCLRALGADITTSGDTVKVNKGNFPNAKNPILDCKESGSTLRFFIPLSLCLDKDVIFHGSDRLFERPLDVYETLCVQNGFKFEKNKNALTVCGKLESKEYKIKGNVSSQFITGLIFALVYLGENSTINIIPPFESASYVNLTLSALKDFGADVKFIDKYTIQVNKSNLCACSGKIEGDYSNAAFLDAFNYIGSDVKIYNLNNNSLQGDKVYKDYFEKISSGTPSLDISDCPDLGPVLIALASLKNGAIFTGTDRLKIKESDRGLAMHQELQKLGGKLIFDNNCIKVPKQDLKYNNICIDGHNDHRIVMAMSVILSKTGGEISGIQAVQKSYPHFFEDLTKLSAKVILNDS